MPAHDHDEHTIPERQCHPVLTDRDHSAIAEKVAELLASHHCQFTQREVLDIREAANTVIVTKRLAFKMGVAFAGAIAIAAAGGFVWMLKAAFFTAVHGAAK